MRGSPMRRAGVFLLVAGAALLLFAAAGLILASLPPRGWQDPLQIAADPTSADRARSLEQNLAAAVSRIREPNARWAVRIHAHDVNAWLAVRLPQWRSHDPSFAWPLEGVAAEVRCDPGCMTLLLETGGRIFSCDVVPSVEGGAVRLQPARGAIGRLPVPSGGAIAWRFLDGETAAQKQLPTLHPLHDGRTVEICAVDVVDGAIEIECITRSAASAADGR
ncbi:MAG: hypothetical protein FJ256_02285 [Phycisphaerae bacterium]|nr:hypothetical protein [Phycisphaerae bacterium]